MNELQQRYGSRGLTIVAINVDAKREDAERFLRQYPATFAVVYDARRRHAARVRREGDAELVPGRRARAGSSRSSTGFLDERRRRSRRGSARSSRRADGDRPALPRSDACAAAAASLSLVLAALVAGCATMAPPQPWEKGTLARPEMQFDPDPLDTKITQHIYTSKEAATRRLRRRRRRLWLQLTGKPGRARPRRSETRCPASRRPVAAVAGGALLAAALALPGMVPGGAGAQAAPDRGLVELKYLDYRDWQPGADRMTVRSPSLYAVKPLSDTLVVEGSLVYDSMSGASPLYFNTLSGASGLGVTDYRTAGDVKVTKYFDGVAIGVGAAVSSERDYLSRAGSLELRGSSRTTATARGRSPSAAPTTGSIRSTASR